jgi:hypothetical protein
MIISEETKKAIRASEEEYRLGLQRMESILYQRMISEQANAFLKDLVIKMSSILDNDSFYNSENFTNEHLYRIRELIDSAERWAKYDRVSRK